MLEKILKLYSMAMLNDVRSPLPHLYGPPGCGKSTVVQQAADLIGCKLHVINVSRISPLELEGVQMPHSDDESALHLKLLHATFWTQLKEGDILLFDEFLRGFPEVYNGLLDIITSRRVADLELPRVFIMAASNSTVAYDSALTDRLLHLPVADPRSDNKAKKQLAKLIINELGLMPEIAASVEMHSLLDAEVLPMFSILDQQLGQGATAPIKGSSIRKLIGQALLHEIQAPTLHVLLGFNNRMANQQSKLQYAFFTSAQDIIATEPDYEEVATKLLASPKLTEMQRRNITIHLELLQADRIKKEKESPSNDELIDYDDLLN